MHVEAQVMPGKGALILTGQLGDVMKESAQAALSFARVQVGNPVAAGDYFADHQIHIHVPAGAVPKDGPSAGITMATVLVSLVTGIAIRRDVAMTGELTLRGRVLPVGGLKEKLLAAVRAGLRTAIVPAGNMAEIDELPPHVREKIRIEPVSAMAEVLAAALARPLPEVRPGGAAGRRAQGKATGPRAGAA